ncbi:MAG: LamG-like jellyroll fold domain-containing protein, partial [Flavobacteriales bacterium]
MLKIKNTLIAIILLVCFESFGQNTALHFDSLNTHVQTTSPGISGGSQARTIEAWIKTTSNHIPGTSGGKQGVIVDYGTFVTGGRFTFNVLWGNAIRIEVGGNGLSGSIPVNDGNWHHVAVVYNPSATNKYSLYVDSVLDVTGNLTVST